MKKKFCFLLLNFLYIIFISCNKQNSQNNSQFTASSIVRNINNIEIIVDPNVEMMMILGRLAGASSLEANPISFSYMNELDEYFKAYKYETAVNMIQKNNLSFDRVPEFGMYLNEDDSGFILDIKDKKFIVHDPFLSHVPAKKVPYYALNNFREAVREFRKNSNFDLFFHNNYECYESMINRNINLLKDAKIDEWLKSFYGLSTKEKFFLHLTYIDGNYGIDLTNSRGKKETHAVVLGSCNRETFLFLCAHEFSHPHTAEIVEQLYSNLKIKNKYDNYYLKDALFYNTSGYGSGFSILNEIINQACANKYLQKEFPDDVMNRYMDELQNKSRYLNIKLITNFLDNYENNRKKYKTMKDFLPELEKFIEGLE